MDIVQETERSVGGKIPLRWDTHTALGLIIVTSVISIAILRGSLAKGGAIQP